MTPISFTPAQQRALVEEAARAPSAHNAQPARWWFAAGRIELHEDTRCWLDAADASGRDNRIALGMAWEAMALALPALGVALSEPVLDVALYPPEIRDVRPIARAEIQAARGPSDPLARWQSQRRCWRGEFAPATAAACARLDDCIRAQADTAIALPESLREDTAAAYDRAAAAQLRDGAVAAELHRWLRLSRRHPRHSHDGLSADCLHLSRPAAFAASWLMRPAVLRWLDRVGLLGAVAAERRKTLSAARLVAIVVPTGMTPFDAGRRWYRFWLALAAAGFAAVPMSALADDLDARAWLLDRLDLGPARTLINFMRVGVPPSPPPLSARRPADDLLLT